MIVEQLGLAIIAPLVPPADRSLMPAMCSGFTSGITSGTPRVMRKAELLSTTTQPVSRAIGPNFLLIDPPAENSAKSTPLKLASVSSSIVYGRSLNTTVLPAEREEASSLREENGK